MAENNPSFNSAVPDYKKLSQLQQSLEKELEQLDVATRAAIVQLLLDKIDSLNNTSEKDPAGLHRRFQIGDNRYSLAELEGKYDRSPKILSQFSYADLGLSAQNISNFKSRSEIDTSIPFLGLELKFPIIAPMTAMTGDRLILKASELGGIACDLRIYPSENPETRIDKYKKWVSEGVNFIPTVGAKGENNLDLVQKYLKIKIPIILIDTAHGGVVDSVWKFAADCLKLDCDNTKFVVGNFGNRKQVEEFFNYLEKNTEISIEEIKKRIAIKVGIGPGSGCTTRDKTGVLEVQAHAVADIACIPQITILADGGNQTGEGRADERKWANPIVAMALTSHPNNTVIVPVLGRSVGGVEESKAVERGIRVIDGKKHVRFHGDASVIGKKEMGMESSNRRIEGESGYTLFAGPLIEHFNAWQDSLASTFSYTGAKNYPQFIQNAAIHFVNPSQKSETAIRLHKLSEPK